MEVHKDLQNVPDSVSLADMDYMFHGQLQRARTPVTTAFFSLQNLEQLNQRIGWEVGQKLNRPKILIVPTVEFFTYVTDLLDSTANRPNVNQTVCSANQQVVDHEVPIHYHSLRRRELFFKWFIFKDRPRVMDRPVLTHGRHRNNPISNGMYGTENPDGKNFSRFQDYQQRLKCDKSAMVMPLFKRYFDGSGG